jgi:hypothetical protein
MARKLGLFFWLLLIFSVAARAAISGHEMLPFDELKTLVGEWEGTNSAGAVKATYTLVAGGSALMERLQSANEPEMITMYSADGDHIVVTHYCSGGNQPQMKSEVIMMSKPQKYSFALVRVTGLKTLEEGHMVGLVLTLVDNDHLTQEWTYQNKGKTSADRFQFKRKLEKPATIVPSGN